MKTVIFLINGGIGKNIIATAVVEAIKKKYPDRKIIIFCSYPEAFFNNPNVYKIYHSNNITNFYEDFIKNKDVLFFGQDVYNTNQFIVQGKHIIQSWIEALNLNYNGELPKIYLSQAEIFNIYKYKRNKPILLIQNQAGYEPYYNWVRDIPHSVTQKLVNNLKDKYNIFHIKNPNQQNIIGAETVTGNLREMITLLSISEKKLLVNSFLQHASAALEISSTVYWIFTDPKRYGYVINRNIQPDDLNQEYLNTYSFTTSNLTLGPELCNIDLKKHFIIEKIINNLN